MSIHRLVAVSLLLSAHLGSPLRAAEGPDTRAMQERLFGRPVVGQKAHACFRRSYDGAHLGRHPQQNVRTMMLLVTADPGGGPDDLAAQDQLVLDVSFRREGRHFETVGNCRSLAQAAPGASPAAPAHCGIDCDGGSLDVSLKGADTVMVGIPERARIWPVGTDPEDDTGPYRKRFGPDDTLFRLERTALSDCIGLVSDPDEKAALRRGR